jgi:hypothetical protein
MQVLHPLQQQMIREQQMQKQQSWTPQHAHLHHLHQLWQPPQPVGGLQQLPIQ